MIVLLFILWIIFDGKITAEITVAGVIVSIAVAFFCKKFFFNEKKNVKHFIVEDFMLVAYIVVLIVEIIKANIAVLTIMLSPKIEIEPYFCTFTTDLKNPIHRILLANSITLTPGTITVELSEKGVYKVHCLDKSFAPGMDDSIFVKMLRKMEEL